MPPAAAAIAVPVALGVAGMFSQNAQNKAANANNLNQQGAAANAWKKAQAKFNTQYPVGQGPTGTLGGGPPGTAPPPAPAGPMQGGGASTTGMPPGVPAGAGAPPAVPPGGVNPAILQAMLRRIQGGAPGTVTPVPGARPPLQIG